jgi:hypothetical protein
MNLQHIRVSCFRSRPGEAAPLWRAPFPAPLFGVSAEQTRFLLFFSSIRPQSLEKKRIRERKGSFRKEMEGGKEGN